MPGFTLFSLRAALVASLFLVASMSGPLAQQRVGIHSAVNPDATGLPPGATPRRLVIGQDAVFNERITTTASGQTQVLFLDQSSMTIGPNSDLTIDQFVFDPKTGTGKLAMSATRGLLRYVGGKLSKQDEGVTLRTSTASIAIRGGAFIANINGDGTVDAVFIYGKSLAVAGVAGGLQIVTRPGYHSATIRGGSPSPPAPAPAGELALLTQQLDGRSGGTGGAKTVPTDASVVNSGVSGTISGNITSSVQQAAATQPQTTPLTTATTPPGTTSQFNSAGQVVDCASALTCGSLSTTQVTTTPLDQLVSNQNSMTSSITGSLLPTSITDINLLKATAFIGTYTGTASGTVAANGASIAASGGFSGTYNFGTQTGALVITNFTGPGLSPQTFATSGSAPLSGATYTGSVTQPGLTGAIVGTFLGPKAAETSGGFAFQTTIGTPILASGTYSGKR